MKYKKATVTGIALTLALVLAVTVGFASNPGEPKEEPNIEADTQDAVISTPTPAAPDDTFSDDLPTGAEDDFVCFDSTSDPDVILKEYKAVLDRAVAQGKLTQTEADELLANMEMLIELAIKGEIKGLMFNKQADGAVTFAADMADFANVNDQDGMYICIREDCGNNSVHEHDGVMYTAWRGKISMPAPDPCAREDCLHQPSVHFHNADGSVSYVPTGLLIYVDEDSAGDGGEPFYAPSGYTWVEQEKFYMAPDEYAAKVEEYRAELQSAVDKGLIAQEEMDRAMTNAVGEIQRVRSGEIVPFYVEYGEGEHPDGFTFTFGYEGADYVGSIGVMKMVPID